MNKKKESNDFWKDIIYKKGKLDEKQILKELSDFYYIMQEVPKVYVEVTGGRLSKLMYPAETIIGFLNDDFYSKGITQDDVKDMMKNCDTLEELKEELSTYFDILNNHQKEG